MKKRMERKDVFVYLAALAFWALAGAAIAAEPSLVRKVIDQYGSLAKAAEERGNIAVPGTERFSVGRILGSFKEEYSFLCPPQT